MKSINLNIAKILEAQTKLDKAISNKMAKMHSKSTLKVRIIALLVELSELANELQFFKYWKENKKINQQRIIEEYSDGIHFINSLSIPVKIPCQIKSKLLSEDLSEQFLAVYSAVSQIEGNYTKEYMLNLYELYLGVAVLCGFSEEEIVKAYFAKNAINFERVKNHY